MKKLSLLACTLTALTALLYSCTAETSSASTAKNAKANLVHIHDQTLPVVCGCAIEEVHKCGEWVTIDGKNVQFANKILDADGKPMSMPFCQKTGLTAKLEGDVVDGKFVHDSIEIIAASKK